MRLTKRYVSTLEEVPLPKKKVDEPLEESEKSILRAAVGKILWPATHTRPDLSFDAGTLAASISNGKMRDLIRVNKLIRRLKYDQPLQLLYPNLGPVINWSLVVFTDASLSNNSDCYTQGGFLVLLVNIESRKVSILSWRSFKLRRVARSTLAAETLACIEGADTAVF